MFAVDYLGCYFWLLFIMVMVLGYVFVIGLLCLCCGLRWVYLLDFCIDCVILLFWVLIYLLFWFGCFGYD